MNIGYIVSLTEINIGSFFLMGWLTALYWYVAIFNSEMVSWNFM